MKDEEFQKKLEIILQTFYNIDREVKKYIDKEKSHLINQDYKNRSYYSEKPILDDKYEKENSDGK
ncbi:MAG: hypothetical protein Q8N77_02625 [Nanoarchaeota archaeon]|nr:hypothetical protein [Nanoarchaeota archaeon]